MKFAKVVSGRRKNSLTATPCAILLQRNGLRLFFRQAFKMEA
jgi:hypothetical protein